MDKLDILGYIIAFVFIALCIYIYFKKDDFELTCIISTVDGNKYCVRERDRIQEAADLLAKTTVKCTELVNYVKSKYPLQENVKRLVINFNPKKIMEILPTSDYTVRCIDDPGDRLWNPLWLTSFDC